MFLLLYSINWPDFIAWLPLFPEIYGNICIVIVSFPGCEVINFGIDLVFLIKPLFYMKEKSKKKSKYFENEKNF